MQQRQYKKWTNGIYTTDLITKRTMCVTIEYIVFHRWFPFVHGTTSNDWHQ